MGMSVLFRFSSSTANYCVYKCLNNVFKFSCGLQSSCIDVLWGFFYLKSCIVFVLVMHYYNVSRCHCDGETQCQLE